MILCFIFVFQFPLKGIINNEINKTKMRKHNRDIPDPTYVRNHKGTESFCHFINKNALHQKNIMYVVQAICSAVYTLRKFEANGSYHSSLCPSIIQIQNGSVIINKRDKCINKWSLGFSVESTMDIAEISQNRRFLSRHQHEFNKKFVYCFWDQVESLMLCVFYVLAPWTFCFLDFLSQWVSWWLGKKFRDPNILISWLLSIPHFSGFQELFCILEKKAHLFTKKCDKYRGALSSYNWTTPKHELNLAPAIERGGVNQYKYEITDKPCIFYMYYGK